jgi:hypothetical protein
MAGMLACGMREDGQALRPGQLKRHTMLPLGYAADARTQAWPDEVRRAVWALLACRPAPLGGHIQACPKGPSARVWDHACRHRLCPPWAWGPVARGLATPPERRLAGEHSQVILTMPQERHARWRATGAVLTPR